MKLLVFKLMALASLLLFSGCGDSVKSGDDYLSIELKSDDFDNNITQTGLAIQAKDDIIIRSVSINRGNCPVGLSPMAGMVYSMANSYNLPTGIKYTLEKDLPLDLAFSQSILIPINCNLNSVLETTIETNQGTFTWTWK